MTPLLIQPYLGQTSPRPDTQDSLIDQATENELIFLVVILFFIIVFILGILSRRVENLMMVGFSLCALLIVIALLLMT